ncbi:MAG: hypothetical protein R3C56_22005 [Pirellulaceae bacterium]
MLHNDPGGRFRNALDQFQRHHCTDTGIGVGSDLLLTRLSSPVAGIATPCNWQPASSLVGEELFVWGQSNKADPFLNTRLGRNEVTEVAPAFSDPELVGTGDIFVYDYNTTSGLGADEAKVVTGDSGGPSFIVGPDGNWRWSAFTCSRLRLSRNSRIVGRFWRYLEVTSFIDELNTAMFNTGSSEPQRWPFLNQARWAGA